MTKAAAAAAKKDDAPEVKDDQTKEKAEQEALEAAGIVVTADGERVTFRGHNYILQSKVNDLVQAGQEELAKLEADGGVKDANGLLADAFTAVNEGLPDGVSKSQVLIALEAVQNAVTERFAERKVFLNQQAALEAEHSK